MLLLMYFVDMVCTLTLSCHGPIEYPEVHRDRLHECVVVYQDAKLSLELSDISLSLCYLFLTMPYLHNYLVYSEVNFSRGFHHSLQAIELRYIMC